MKNTEIEKKMAVTVEAAVNIITELYAEFATSRKFWEESLRDVVRDKDSLISTLQAELEIERGISSWNYNLARVEKISLDLEKRVKESEEQTRFHKKMQEDQEVIMRKQRIEIDRLRNQIKTIKGE